MSDASSGREIRRAMVWIIWTALIFLFVWYAWELLFLAFAGFLLAIILRTLADWVAVKTGLGDSISYAVTVCGIVILIGIAAWLLVPSIIEQAAQIIKIIPGSIQKAKDEIDKFSWGPRVVEMVKQGIAKLDIASKLAAMTTGFFDAIAAAVIVIIVGFFAGLNPREYTGALLHLVPEEKRARAMHVAEEVVYVLRWWMLGQLVPMVVLGVVTMIGLWLLGVPLAFTLGLFTGLMIFIPYLGALISEIPAVLVALKQGPKTLIYVIILYLVVHSLEGYVLTPLVQKRAVKLFPVLTILAQMFMWTITGVLGVAIATPLAAAGLVLVKMLYLDEEISHAPGRLTGG